MSRQKMKSIGVATLKTLGAQYSSFSGVVEQVVDLHSEFEIELSQVLSLVYEKDIAKRSPGSQTQQEIHATELASDTGPGPAGNVEDEGPKDPVKLGKEKETVPWMKKLFKRIAIHCHPDKVLASNAGVTEKHKRMSSYEKARNSLDEDDQPMMISIGLIYDEIPEIGVAKSKKILTTGVSSLQSVLDAKQKSVVWSWGMSEDDLQIKSKILVHAALQLYNKRISEPEALVLVKEYFEIKDKKSNRKIGTHPGARLKNRRNKS